MRTQLTALLSCLFLWAVGGVMLACSTQRGAPADSDEGTLAQTSPPASLPAPDARPNRTSDALPTPDENGRYEVAVSIGWHDRSYDSHRVVVEAQLLFDSVATTPQTPYRVASTEVTVGDGNLTVEIGQHDAYTMLNWISIEPVD